MANIAEFAVQLTARTGKFTRGMRGAERPVNRFANTVRMAGRRIAGFGAIAGGLAVFAMARMVKGSFASIDATSKLADNLGLTTKQLVGYQHAAKLSGVESNQLATAFKRMEKNISDAKLGLTTAQRAFGTEAGLGLDFKRLAELSPDQQFKTIADALNRMKSQTDKVRVALDLFGRSGLGVIKMAEQGSAGLSAMQKEAEKLGIAFSRLDGAKVEKANDAMARVGSVFRGMSDTLAIELAKPIEDMAKKFTDWATTGTNAADRVRSALGQLKPIIEGIGIAFKQLGFLEDLRRWQVGISGAILAPAARLLTAGGTSEADKRAFRARANLPGPGEVAGSRRETASSQFNRRNAALLGMASPIAAGRRPGGEPFDGNFQPWQPNQMSATAFGSGRKELAAPGLSLPDKIDRVLAVAEDVARTLNEIEENTAAAA